MTLLAALTLLPGLASLPLIDRDEPRFARATLEMMQRDTLVIPYFNGDYRFDKPPLTYWWMQLHFEVLGVNAFSARLHSVLSALGVALVLFFWGRRLDRPLSGWIAGASWLTCFQVLIHARLAVADMPLILCIVTASWALWGLLCAPQTPRRFGPWYWLLWLSLGLGFLAKGPLAFAIPALTLLLWRWPLGRQPLPWGRLQALSGAALALGIVALWGLPALVQTGGAFWERGMGDHVIDRGLTSFNDRLFIPGVYYLGTVFLSLFPWSVALVPIGLWLRRHWSAEAAFLCAWFIAPFLVFSFYTTQLPHYILPGFPAFCLALGCAWPQLAQSLGGWRIHLFAWLPRVILAAVALLLVTASTALEHSVAAPLQHPARFGALLVLCLLLMSLRSVWTRPLRFGALVLLMAVALQYTALSLQRSAAVAGLFDEGADEAPADVLTAPEADPPFEARRQLGVHFAEPGLVWYSGDYWRFAQTTEAVQALLEGEPGATDGARQRIVVLAREWRMDASIGSWLSGSTPEPTRDLREALEPAAAAAPASGWQWRQHSGINFARTSWVELWVWER